MLEPIASVKSVIITRLDKRYPPDEKDFAGKKDRIKQMLLIRKQGEAFDSWFVKRSESAKLKVDLNEL